MNINIKFDSSEFEKGLKRANEITLKALEKGMGVAMLSMLGDCINEIPTVPLKEGWLRGSGSVFVDNKLIDVSQSGLPKFALTSLFEPLEEKGLIGVIGFNAPYAAKMHEGIDFHFTEPSSGAKYLETKMHRNKKRYVEIISDEVRKELKS